MQTGSSETLIGWKSGKTTGVPMEPNGGSMAMDSAVHDHRLSSRVVQEGDPLCKNSTLNDFN
jgi:hypothetical protein